MIEFALTTMTAEAGGQKGFSIGFKLAPGDAVSEVEIVLLKNYLTPAAWGVLEKLLEAERRMPHQGQR